MDSTAVKTWDEVDTLPKEDAEEVDLEPIPEAVLEKVAAIIDLQDEAEKLEEALRSKSGWLGFGASMPEEQVRVHRQRLHQIRSHVAGLSRVAQVLHLGYEPYSLSEDWYVGMAGRALIFDPNIQLTYQFKAPLQALYWTSLKWRRVLVSLLDLASPLPTNRCLTKSSLCELIRSSLDLWQPQTTSI